MKTLTLETTKKENIEQKIFEMPEKGFTKTEETFLRDVICREQQFLIESVKDIISRNPNYKARILFDIAESFRMNVVETNMPEIEELRCESYQDILYSEIYNIDYFKIAKELLRQYEEYTKVALVS